MRIVFQALRNHLVRVVEGAVDVDEPDPLAKHLERTVDHEGNQEVGEHALEAVAGQEGACGGHDEVEDCVDTLAECNTEYSSDQFFDPVSMHKVEAVDCEEAVAGTKPSADYIKEE